MEKNSTTRHVAIVEKCVMTEMDGCEAAEAIRALPREDAHAVPILALTGNSGSDDVERAMAAGMNDFMVKPVQMKLLAQMMSAYLQHCEQKGVRNCAFTGTAAVCGD